MPMKLWLSSRASSWANTTTRRARSVNLSNTLASIAPGTATDRPARQEILSGTHVCSVTQRWPRCPQEVAWVLAVVATPDT